MDKNFLHESCRRHLQTDSFVPLLALLEYPLPEARALVQATFSPLEASPHDDNVTFPYGGLIAFALSAGGSSYWSEKAVGWLEQGAEVTDRIAVAVHQMVKAKGGTQNIRHRAFRIVRRWERAKAA